MSAPKTIVINCGASHVCYAVFSAKAGSLAIEELHTEELHYDYSSDDGWLSAVIEKVKAIQGRAKSKGGAHVILPGYQLLTKSIKIPHVEGNRGQHIAYEAQQNIPYKLSEVVWGHQEIADDGIETQVILIAVKAVNAHRFCSELNAIGVHPATVQASSILDYNAYRYAYGYPEECTLLVNIGARATNLLFIDPSGLSVRTINLGGNALTQSLSDSMGQHFMQAEQTKIGYCSGAVQYEESDPALQIIQRSIEGYLKRLSQEITRSIVNFKRQKKGVSPSSILLTGRGCLMPGLAEALTESQRLAVGYFDPTQGLGTSGSVSRGKLDTTYFMLSEVVGQACRDAIQGPFGVDLMPPAIRDHIAFTRRKPLLIGAAALLAMAPLPALLHYATAGGKYERDTQSIRSAINEYNQSHSEILRLTEQASLVRDRLVSVEDLVKSRFNWISFLSDMQQRLVGVRDVWLDEMKMVRHVPSLPPISPSDASAPPEPQEPPPPEFRLQVKGRILVRDSSSTGFDRINTLINQIKESEFILEEVKELTSFGQRESEGRIVPFTFTLRVNPEKPL